MSPELWDLLRSAAATEKGHKLDGRAQKARARELEDLGFARCNKSRSRLFALPAGKWLVDRAAKEPTRS